MTCAEKDKEPYFRHIVKKWTQEYDPNVIKVEIHNNMYTEAAKVLQNLPEVLEKKYGKSAADALKYTHQEFDAVELQATSVITLDTEDRYMNGSAQFIFTGLETLMQPKNEQQTQSEERSMNVKSTTSGLTGHQTMGSNNHMMDLPNRDVDVNIGITPSISETSEPPDQGWTQVGTDADKDQLQRQVQAASPNPGDDKGQQDP